MKTSLPNTYFEDIPIEFKEINPIDFNEYYSVDEKIIIEPNEEGFISDVLQPIFDEGFDTQNTVVINAGVGQGKSHSVINMLTKYANSDDYLVIVAVPYNNLINQYVKDISQLISPSRIFNFLNIQDVYFGEKSKEENFFLIEDTDLINEFKVTNYDVHVLTINALLGNPGDTKLFQAMKKTRYFNKLRGYCEKANKKLVLILDEVHDSIHNFREEHLYKLWNYQDLVHKIFIVSATFNEASKEVIKYLSEFTNRKIQIIEAKRIRILEKQSRLHINFFSGYTVDQDAELIKLTEKLIKNKKPFDMMVYSKSLTTKFLAKPLSGKYKTISMLLHPLKDQINKCYSDPFDPKANQKYNSSKINIGTNFSTGISIKKENHSYIIIFPKDISIEYFNNKGVFTSGVNAVIQSLARQRKKGDIYIFLPRPLDLSKNSLPYDEFHNDVIYDVFQECKSFTSNPDTISYTNINNQYKELHEVYEKLYNRSSLARRKINETNRTGMNRLLYPPKEIFIMEKGEKFLSGTFFGGDLSAYILWASICNQFLNCRLESIQLLDKIYLSSGDFEDTVDKIYHAELNTYILPFKWRGKLVELSHPYRDYEVYSFFEKYFFDEHITLMDNKRLNGSQVNKIKRRILELILGNGMLTKQEAYYKYLKSCIYFSSILNINELEKGFVSFQEIEIINLFKDWYPFVELLEQHKEITKKYQRLPTKVLPEFETLFYKLNMKDKIEQLRIKELFLSTDIFQFNDTFKRYKTNPHYLNGFYVLLIKVLYNGNLKQSTKDKISVSYYNLEDIEFENSNLKNLLYKPIPEYIL